jgi:hypothetical protein
MTLDRRIEVLHKAFPSLREDTLTVVARNAREVRVLRAIASVKRARLLMRSTSFWRAACRCKLLAEPARRVC